MIQFNNATIMVKKLTKLLNFRKSNKHGALGHLNNISITLFYHWL